jgi:predicted metal-dependent phosphoesterase TrpH
MFTRIAAVLAITVIGATPAFAQKKPELMNFPFWRTPKQPHANAFVPGLQAALELTPTQVEKIIAAQNATVNSPELQGLKQKGDPNATADELAKANAKRNEAREKLFQAVDEILTKDQKALIEKMNEAYEKVVGEVGEQFQAKFVAAKGNAEEMAAVRKEHAEALAEGFDKRLNQLLTTEQKLAVEKAAEVEKKRAAEAKDKPKPGK